MKEKLFKLSGPVVLGLVLLAALIVGIFYVTPAEPPIARSYSCAVYTEQGCAKFVVASGGEIEIQSGGTFDLQAGATTDFSGGIDLDGATLDFDADGDTEMVASSDDIITATINSGTGYFVIGVGNLKVGNGTPSTAQNGEDAYIEGGFETDGTARFDGAIDANSTADIAGNISSSSGAITMTDNVLIDGAADAEQLVAQGYTTQTNSIFVVETSAGTDVFEVTTSAANLNNNPLQNIGAAGTDFGTDGSLTTAQTITITTGGLAVSAGGASITGTVSIDGAADAEQLVAQGYTTQTNSIFVVETSAGTDVFEVTTSAANLNNNPLQNIGAAGTDFGSDGSLTTALTVTITSGGLTVTAGGVDIQSGDITMENDETFSNSQDGVITTTVAAGGYFVVDTGNFKTGNGTPDVTLNGEDAYVEGTFEADGAARFDSTVEINGDITLENDETFSNSQDGVITTTVAATGHFGVITGNLKIGNGSPSLTLNGEDAYIEGSLEADGAARFDGGVTVGVGDVTISNGLLLRSFSDLAVSDGDMITPTVDIYALDTSGNVTITIGACSNDGQDVKIIGDDANNIIINATNLRTTDGNALTINQYDVVGLVCQDTEWLLMFESNNQ